MRRDKQLHSKRRGGPLGGPTRSPCAKRDAEGTATNLFMCSLPSGLPNNVFKTYLFTPHKISSSKEDRQRTRYIPSCINQMRHNQPKNLCFPSHYEPRVSAAPNLSHITIHYCCNTIQNDKKRSIYTFTNS